MSVVMFGGMIGTDDCLVIVRGDYVNGGRISLRSPYEILGLLDHSVHLSDISSGNMIKYN